MSGVIPLPICAICQQELGDQGRWHHNSEEEGGEGYKHPFHFECVIDQLNHSEELEISCSVCNARISIDEVSRWRGCFRRMRRLCCCPNGMNPTVKRIIRLAGGILSSFLLGAGFEATAAHGDAPIAGFGLVGLGVSISVIRNTVIEWRGNLIGNLSAIVPIIVFCAGAAFNYCTEHNN